MKLCNNLGFVFGCGLMISAISAFNNLGKFIIDTDVGGDDAVAILLALTAEKHWNNNGYEIVAITCTYGNTNVKNVENNVLKVLTIANRTDIPVYGGVSKPLLKNFTLDYHFGQDGFGDFEFEEKILGQVDRSKHASVAMIDIARKYSGNISVIAIGPLTNVALATTLDPNFVKNVVRFYIMGSSVRGVGNVAPNVEFNFNQDPHSNFIVLNGTGGQPALLFPWETSLSAGIPMEWRKKILGGLDSRLMEYINKIESKSLGDPTWIVADVMLCAVALWPELIKQSLVTNLTPVFDGAGTGSVLVDYANNTGKSENVEILQSFDVKGFQKLLLQVFS